MAWEGEKTLTFTVEDALLSLESFWALTGADQSYDSENKTQKFVVKPTSFAAYYSIKAHTLVRDESGVDHAALITIPKAKLQTSLNLSMAPTGDPSAFTFTFDAFPETAGDQDSRLFQLEIFEIAEEDKITADADGEGKKVTTIFVQGKKAQVSSNNTGDATVSVSSDGKITLTHGAASATISGVTVGDAKTLVGPTGYAAQGKSFTIAADSVTTLYIVETPN
jgi:hypothetical protein